MNPSQPPLITALLDPKVYPHAVSPPIQLIQTHASYIFLTGTFAYKLKKPVDYGFLNYSTLAARRHFLQEELRLNQRTAPELYLAVVALIQGGDRLEFRPDSNCREETTEGEVLEYALQMRQFPADSLFSDLLEQNRLTPELMEKLAVQVARLHQSAAVSEKILEFGKISQIRQAFDENYAQTRVYIGRGQTEAQWQETQALTQRFFTEHTAVFQDRIQQEKIRECHGDLHLGNIGLWGESVFLFDCIEFNDAFRFVDTLYDVAFPVMDCEVQGRQDLAIAFLNAYLELTGDWEGGKVLPIYLSRQAYVRAKVTSFRLEEPGLSAGARSQIEAIAARYYHYAWSCLQPKQGHVILMSGLSGSGKSTVARQLAQRIGAIQIRSDAVRKHLGGIALQERGPESLYQPEMTQRTYQKVLEIGLQLAQAGYPVILDAKYDRRALRQAVFDQAQALGIPCHILSCEAPVEVLKNRLTQRQNDIADATVDLLDQQQQQAEAFTEQEERQVSHLDTTLEIQPQLDCWIATCLRSTQNSS